MKIKTKLLSEKLYNLDQSWFLERLVEMTVSRDRAINPDVHKLRVKIRQNAYEFQSYGLVEVWTRQNEGGTWAALTKTPGSMLKCKDAVSYVLSEERVRNEGGYELMVKDVEALLEEAKNVLV